MKARCWGVVMKKTNKITDGALLTAIYIVLLLTVVFIPVMFLPGLIMLPIPFIVYATRYSYRPAIVMFLVALALTLLVATFISLPITLLAGVGGIVIGHAIYTGRKPYEIWAQGTLGYIVSLIVIFVLAQLVFNINIYHETEAMINESIQIMRAAFEQFNLPAEQMKMFEALEEQMRFFPDLLPASIAISSILLAFGSTWLSFKIMNRIERKQYAFPPFRKFLLPKSLIFIYAVVLIAILFFNGGETFVIITSNIYMLLFVLFVIQGFSFIFFIAHLKNWHRSIPIVAVVISLLFPSLFMLMAQFLGIIDLAFNFRKHQDETNK